MVFLIMNLVSCVKLCGKVVQHIWDESVTDSSVRDDLNALPHAPHVPVALKVTVDFSCVCMLSIHDDPGQVGPHSPV